MFITYILYVLCHSQLKVEDELTYPPVLYKAGLGTGYLELPQVEIPQGLLVRSLLKTNEVFILDYHTDIFVWLVIIKVLRVCVCVCVCVCVFVCLWDT